VTEVREINDVGEREYVMVRVRTKGLKYRRVSAVQRMSV